MKYRQPGYHDADYKQEREKREKRGPRNRWQPASWFPRCAALEHESLPAY